MDYEIYLEAAASALKRALSSPLMSEEESGELISFVLNVQNSLVPTTFCNETALTEFWSKNIRPKMKLTTSVITMTTHFKFLTGLSGNSWNEFVEVVANSCATFDNTSCVDKTFTDRVANKDAMKDILLKNSWAVFLIILAISTPVPQLTKSVKT